MAELKAVSKAFGRGRKRVEALRGVDLAIYPGQLTLIEGPSGSGKTTLLHILGLLQVPDAGEVRLGGRRVDQLPQRHLPDERRRNVVIIVQGENLLASLTVRDNVALAERLHGVVHGLTPVMDNLRRFELEERAGHLPCELSGGERQRVAIVRALACPGRLVLADEPTANLDWRNARQVVERLRELAKCHGKAVVMVTHDTRLEPYVDRIVRIMDGRIIDDHSQSPIPTTDEWNGSGVEKRGLARRRRGSSAVVLLCIALLVVLGTVLAVKYFGIAGAANEFVVACAPPSGPEFVAAAPAVIEPSTRLLTLQTERRGRIEAILKHAGESILEGDPLVILDTTIPAAMVKQREADLRLAEANLAELIAWHRPEQRAWAQAAVEHAEVRVQRAERELNRLDALFDSDFASDTERDYTIEEHRLATTALEQARQAAKIAEAGPTPEATTVAQARVAQAAAALELARSELSHYTIVSPLDGHVIYRHLEPGEVVDPQWPMPILSIGNLDDVRLRAEVDEADIRRVYVDQRVLATAEAFGDRQFTGRVVHLEPMMGRKSIRTERTTEKHDTKVREVLIELDPPYSGLPIDLQMTVRFLAGNNRNDLPPPLEE